MNFGQYDPYARHSAGAYFGDGSATTQPHLQYDDVVTAAAVGAAEVGTSPASSSRLQSLSIENDELRRKVDELEGRCRRVDELEERCRDLEERLMEADERVIEADERAAMAEGALGGAATTTATTKKKKQKRGGNRKRKPDASGAAAAADDRHCVECEVCGTQVYGLVAAKDDGDANNETSDEEDESESDQEEGHETPKEKKKDFNDVEDAELSLKFLEETTPNPVTEGEDGPAIDGRSDPIGAFRQKCNWLRAYKAKYGHCDVVDRKDSKSNPDRKLAFFVSKCRMEYGAHRRGEKGRSRLNLTPNRIKTLEEIGISWVRLKPPPDFDKMFAKLKAFNDEYGHCCVPAAVGADDEDEDEDRRELSEWTKKQRSALLVVGNPAKYGDGGEYGDRSAVQAIRKRMTAERQEALEGLGCIWLSGKGQEEEEGDAARDETAPVGDEGRSAEAKEGKNDKDEEDEELSLKFLEEKTSNPVLERQDEAAIDFRSDPKGAFRQRCNWLRAYKIKHDGHCNVTVEDKGNKKLAFFVSNCQEQQYWRAQGQPKTNRHGIYLTPNRIKTLEDIGIGWLRPPKNSDTKEEEEKAAGTDGKAGGKTKKGKWNSGGAPKNLVGWFQFYEELRKYKSVHGDCWVPTFNQNRGLGGWVIRQRRMHRRICEGTIKVTPVEEHLMKLARDMGLELDPNAVEEHDFERRRKRDMEELKAKDEDRGEQLAKAEKEVEDALKLLEEARRKKKEADTLADLASKEISLANKTISKAQHNVEKEKKKKALDPVGKSVEIAGRGSSRRNGKAVITGRHKVNVLGESLVFYTIKWPDGETEVGVEGRYVTFTDKEYQQVVAKQQKAARKEQEKAKKRQEAQAAAAKLPSRVQTRGASRRNAKAAEAEAAEALVASSRQTLDRTGKTSRGSSSNRAGAIAHPVAATKKRPLGRPSETEGSGGRGKRKRRERTRAMLTPAKNYVLDHPSLGKFAHIRYRCQGIAWGWAKINAVERYSVGGIYHTFYSVRWPYGHFEAGIPEYFVSAISENPYNLPPPTEAIADKESKVEGKATVDAAPLETEGKEAAKNVKGDINNAGGTKKAAESNPFETGLAKISTNGVAATTEMNVQKASTKGSGKNGGTAVDAAPLETEGKETVKNVKGDMNNAGGTKKAAESNPFEMGLAKTSTNGDAATTEMNVQKASTKRSGKNGGTAETYKGKAAPRETMEAAAKEEDAKTKTSVTERQSDMAETSKEMHPTKRCSKRATSKR